MLRAGLIAAAAAALAAPAHGQRNLVVNAEFLVGRWGDNGDCQRAVVFRSDGRFRTHSGGEGSWRLSRDRLTMTGERGATVLRVRAISRTQLAITNPDGSRGTSQRCPAR